MSVHPLGPSEDWGGLAISGLSEPVRVDTRHNLNGASRLDAPPLPRDVFHLWRFGAERRQPLGCLNSDEGLNGLPKQVGLVHFWIGKLKGGTSYDVNQQMGKRQKVLQWQAGYGVVSFGTGDLEWVRKYLRDPREHHGRGTAQDRLERITRYDDEP